MEDRHIVAIDLGSSKVALSVAKINGEDVQVIYYKEAPSKGVRNSYVFNATVTAPLKELIADAEKELDIKITQAVVGMPKYRVRQETGQARLERNEDECITEEEINELKMMALETYPLDDMEKESLFGAVAQSFSNGEDFQLVESDIVGMPSDILEGNFKIFIGNRRALHNIDVAFNNLGIGIARKYFTPDSVAKAILTPAEMENGVALIDFGAGATYVSVYYGNIMRHYASIPFGGHVITSDIKSECMISSVLAENIKKAYGACMPDKLLSLSEKTLQINSNSGAANKQVTVKYLSEIITYRVQEITEAILYEIQKSGFADNLRSGIVLTGGGANLTNCANYIRELSGLNVRKGYPRPLFSYTGCEGVMETSATVSIGLILTAKSDHVTNCIEGEQTISSGSYVTFGKDHSKPDISDAVPEENADTAEDTVAGAEPDTAAETKVERMVEPAAGADNEPTESEISHDKEKTPSETAEKKEEEKKKKEEKPRKTPVWTRLFSQAQKLYNDISADNNV